MKVYNCEKIYFIERVDAEEALLKMNKAIIDHGYVRVADYYKLVGKSTITNDDSKYGWANLDNTTVILDKTGKWHITLPVPYLLFDREVNDGSELRDDNYKCNDKMVSHPSHYQSEKGIEVIDVMEAFTSDLTGIEAIDTAQVLKYICRWKNKNGIQDLNKAMWYLTHLINHVKNNEKEND